MLRTNESKTEHIIFKTSITGFSGFIIGKLNSNQAFNYTENQNVHRFEKA